MTPRIGSLFAALGLLLASAACADAKPLVGQKKKPPEAKEQTLSLTTGYLANLFKHTRTSGRFGARRLSKGWSSVAGALSP